MSNYQTWLANSQIPEYAHKTWEQKNRIRSKLHRYGLTVVEYYTILRRQDGKCLICNVYGGEKLHIDHCAKRGHVRGLLCTTCNAGIGQFRDDPDLLLRAVKYLSGDLNIPS